MPALLAFFPSAVWRWIAIAGVGLSLFGYGYVKGLHHARDETEQEHAAALDAAYHIVSKHEVQYVEKIQQIAGPVVVRDRLVRGVCQPAATVPGKPAFAGAASGYADLGFSDRLGRDLSAARLNQEQCKALIGAVNDINSSKQR